MEVINYKKKVINKNQNNKIQNNLFGLVNLFILSFEDKKHKNVNWKIIGIKYQPNSLNPPIKTAERKKAGVTQIIPSIKTSKLNLIGLKIKLVNKYISFDSIIWLNINLFLSYCFFIIKIIILLL